MSEFARNSSIIGPSITRISAEVSKDKEEVARSLNLAAKEISERIDELHEENPMLGQGCR